MRRRGNSPGTLRDYPSPPGRSARAARASSKYRPATSSPAGGWWRNRAWSSCRWPAAYRPAIRRHPGQIPGPRILPPAGRYISAARPPAARPAPCPSAGIAAHGHADLPSPAVDIDRVSVRSACRPRDMAPRRRRSQCRRSGHRRRQRSGCCPSTSRPVGRGRMDGGAEERFHVFNLVPGTPGPARPAR